MTQEEKDANLGRVIREINEHERQIVHPLVKLQSMAGSLRALADGLDSFYGAMLDGRHFGMANMGGATVCDSYREGLDAAAIVQLEHEIRSHSRDLVRLYSQRSALGG